MLYNFVRHPRRYISVLAAVSLVIQSFLPGSWLGVSPAEASSQTYSFDNASEYSTDANSEIRDGNPDVAIFKMTWEDTVADHGSLDDAKTKISSLISPQDADTILATTLDGVIHRSTDLGETFSDVTPAGGFTATDIVETTGDANDLVAVGGNAIPPIYYSADYGANWTQASSVIAASFVAVTHDSGDNHTWAIADDGTVYRSTDGGDNWSSQGSSGLDEAFDIIWYTGNTVMASGVKTGAAAVTYSTDSGANWSAAELPGSPPAAGITHMANNGDAFYVAGNGYVAQFDFGVNSIANFNDNTYWTNLSSSINSGNFSTIGDLIASDGIVFISLYNTSDTEFQVFSTIDDGTDWQQHGSAAASATEATSLVRTFADGRILWGIADSSGFAGIQLSKFYEADDSVVMTTGISAVSIESIDINYHSSAQVNELGIALGFSTGETDTWYYYDTTVDSGTWIGSTTDSYLKSNTEAEFDANISTFDEDVTITGPIYFKLYMHEAQAALSAVSPLHPYAIVSSIDVTYTSGTITVTSPNGGEVWNVGKNYDITWTTSGAGYSPTSFDLSYSTNSGSSWTAISGGTGYTGGSPFSWQIPAEAESDTVRIKVKDSDTTVEDTSDADFRVTDPGINPLDTEPPTSWVDPLPEYTTTDSFTVAVTAYDNLSGVAEVSLWYSVDQEPGPYEGQTTLWATDYSAPFEFEFVPPQDGIYYFVSSAVDHSGNDNKERKRIDLPPENPGCKPPLCWPILAEPPEIEAYTTVDRIDPYIASEQQPAYQEEGVATESGFITARFNEPIQAGLFDYEFFVGRIDNEEAPADNKLGPISWELGNRKLSIPYSNLEQGTWYTFKITGAYDLAGNELQDGIWPPDEAPMFRIWEFQTAIPQDPNLTNSSFEIINGSTFNVGQTVSYKATIINTSDLPAANTTVGAIFAEGTTYKINSASAGTGEFTFYGDPPYAFEWTGDVVKGIPVIIYFDVTVDNPANDLSIAQSIVINDGINPAIMKTAGFTVNAHPDFATSQKLVDPSTAEVGEVLEYTITVTNTGSTVASVELMDAIPTGTTYLPITLNHTGWEVVNYANGTLTANSSAILSGETFTLEFGVLIDDDFSGNSITNTAQIDSTDDNVAAIPRSATTTIDGGPPPTTNPKIIAESPAPNDVGAPLKQGISVTFNKQMNPDGFEFAITEGGYQTNLTGWTVSWNETGKTATIHPPTTHPWYGDLLIGAVYTVEITAAYDTTGLPLVDGPAPNPWSFTTADPVVAIIEPTDLLVEIPVNTVSPEFIIELQDSISGNAYAVEDPSVEIALLSNSATGRFGTDSRGFVGSINHVDIAQGESRASFYYIDSEISSDFVTISVLENPSQSWGDSDKQVMITGDEEEETLQELAIWTSSTRVEAGRYSQPIVVSANQGEQALSLPRLYFYTQSDTGAFYDENFERLTQWVTVQDTSGTVLQYFTPNPGQIAASFHYLDSAPGTYMITVADNAPLTPDQGMDNASAVMQITAPEEEEDEIEEELEEVEDDTGRVLTELVISPDDTILLPGGIQVFEVTGYDQNGEVIDELIYRWYAIGGGGTIQKEGIDGDSHRSPFTAGNDLGIFYDTVLVATLYNGQIGYAAATVIVTDIVEYGGPTRLPTTGISGLQLIFMGLTLVAAVALAWVTSYEKTHFPEKKK